MNAELGRIWRWLRLARPPRGALLRALLSGAVAGLSAVGLFVGAVALLVTSAARPGLRAVAGVLIVIELLAFLRSPIRFNERMSAHRLGFSAVTRWRRWLVLTIGAWDFSRWRAYSSGDLLERALRDTDELQDLWLRFAIPVVAMLSTLVVTDVVIGLLPSTGGWWTFVAVLAGLQVLGLLGTLANVSNLVRADRRLRSARGGYLAAVVEQSSLAPELTLLVGDAFLERRSRQVRDELGRAEASLRSQRRSTTALAPLVGAGGLAALIAHHPASSSTWMVVIALVVISSYESLGSIRTALDTAVAVSAAAERLEELESPLPSRREPWPVDETIRVTRLRLCEGDAVLVEDASFELKRGSRTAVVGPSGSGKSTLLRALAGLDPVADGRIEVGHTPLGDIDDAELRRHLAFVPSEPGLTRGFASDVILLGRSTQRDIIADLSNIGIATERTTKWDELSRGESERVAIVRSLVTAPGICLYDEPTAGLGHDETTRVLALLASTHSTVVVATHDPAVIAWCDEVLELRDHALTRVSR